MLDSTPPALPLGYRLLTAEVTFARIKKESSPMLEMVRPKIDCQFDRTGGVLGSVATRAPSASDRRAASQWYSSRIRPSRKRQTDYCNWSRRNYRGFGSY